MKKLLAAVWMGMLGTGCMAFSTTTTTKGPGGVAPYQPTFAFATDSVKKESGAQQVRIVPEISSRGYGLNELAHNALWRDFEGVLRAKGFATSATIRGTSELTLEQKTEGHLVLGAELVIEKACALMESQQVQSNAPVGAAVLFGTSTRSRPMYEGKGRVVTAGVMRVTAYDSRGGTKLWWTELKTSPYTEDVAITGEVIRCSPGNDTQAQEVVNTQAKLAERVYTDLLTQAASELKASTLAKYARQSEELRTGKRSR